MIGNRSDLFSSANGMDNYPYDNRGPIGRPCCGSQPNLKSGSQPNLKQCTVGPDGKCNCGPNCKCDHNCICKRNSQQKIPPNRNIEHYQSTTPQHPSAPPYSCANTSVDNLDKSCNASLNQFKNIDPNAAILPGIGLPSQNNGVCTIIHSMGPHAHNLKINGLESKSPLANAGLFSTECADGKQLNLYEMMVPEGLPNNPGEKSNAELYAQELNNQGINVAGSHWHWWASEPYVAAIHHQNVGMNPVEFANKTTNALLRYNNRSTSGNFK